MPFSSQYTSGHKLEIKCVATNAGQSEADSDKDQNNTENCHLIISSSV